MLRQLFGFGRNPNQAATDAIYDSIVAAARRPLLYSSWGVPDTPLGRFEMVALHVFLVLRRLRGEDQAADLAQELTDEFFRDIDHSLREIGIGDMGIPKRMKKLARMFYGRVQSYDEALTAADHRSLQAALRRNILPGESEWPGAEPLSRYVFDASRQLATQPTAALMAGAVTFPQPHVAAATEVGS